MALSEIVHSSTPHLHKEASPFRTALPSRPMSSKHNSESSQYPKAQPSRRTHGGWATPESESAGSPSLPDFRPGRNSSSPPSASSQPDSRLGAQGTPEPNQGYTGQVCR